VGGSLKLNMFPRRVDIPSDEMPAVALVKEAVHIAYNEAFVEKSIAPKHLLIGLAKAVTGTCSESITPLPLTEDARTVLQAAIELGLEHRDGKITVSDLLTALARVRW